MKKLISLITLVFSFTLMASDTAYYDVQKGKLHSGGNASVQILENSATKYVAKLNYEIKKKILVPIPEDQLKGESVIEFPPEFRDERGYLELETKGVIELEKAKLQFIGRTKWQSYNDAYHFVILPKNGRSKIDVIYHPSIKAAGWGKVVITFITSIPIFNGYQVILDINGKN